MKLLLFLLLCSIKVEFSYSECESTSITICTSYCTKPGKTAMRKTPGTVWPQPQQITSTTNFMVLDENLKFTYTGTPCEVLDGTLQRYHDLIFKPPRPTKLESENSGAPRPNVPGQSGVLENVVVNLLGPCAQWPQLDMNENYTLKIDAGNSVQPGLIESQTPWGLLRGLETFSQLIYRETTTGNQVDVINETSIEDFPRFSHRGVLLDTSRHYVSKNVILQNLDAMSYNKFNVFHWHIVDDPSFPYQSTTFPDLSLKGAYVPQTHIYTPSDVSEILDYARRRGIRVVPEFDSPGHTSSWGPGAPNLLTQCYSQKLFQSPVPDGFGPINPILDSTYDFLKALYTEISQVFVDKYVHLGGDEVSFDCWKSNPDIQKFVSNSHMTSYAQLEAMYIKKLADLVNKIGRNYIVWQEVVDNGVPISEDSIVEVWLPLQDIELAKVTALGYKTILASCWYLDYITYGSDWKKYYACDPQNFIGTQAMKDRVIGGEVALWGEFVDGTNLISRMWPRASAAAERLWSNAALVDTDVAAPRLEEQRCRMIRRGINAEPQNGPSFCTGDYLVD